MKLREKYAKTPFPAWLFAALMVVYNELMLHIWILEEFHFGRLAAVTGFAIGFGMVLALLTSFLSPKAAKWTAVALSAAVSVFWLLEYFVSDAYQVFMTPVTIVSGAGGVAEDYFDLVMSLLARNLWRIGLMILPVALYGYFCRGTVCTWKLRGILAAGAVAGYLLGAGAVQYLTNDGARFSRAYEFDSAVRCFGLNMALTLETTQGGAEEKEPAFVTPASQPTLPPVQTECAEDPAVETTEPAIVYGDNVMAALDFDALAASANNSAVASLHRYVGSQTPSKQNEYTGLFKGKNLILITAEAFTQEVIDPELTPTLYRLVNEGVKFTDYYQPAWGASTTSGEFSNVVGLVPTNGGMCMKEPIYQDFFLTMGHQLQNLGYYSTAYHNHNADFYDRNRTHVHLGYDRFLAQYGGLEGITPVWPESDQQMMDITVPQYIDHQPFSIYYMTVSGHCVYSQKENVQSKKHYDKVADLDLSETVKCYLAAQLELEAALTSLVKQLEDAGIADDTVIVMGTDHYPYGLERSGTWKNTSDYLREWYGVEDYDIFIRDHNALILWSGCLEDKDIVIEDPVFSLDIVPTLSNLFGVEYDSRLLVGRDVFSDTEPLVFWPDHSWVTNLGSYNALKDIFTPAEGAQVPEGYVDYITSIVANKITYSDSVLKVDYFNYLSKELGRQ